MKAFRQYLVVKNIKQEANKIGGLEIATDKDEDVRYYKGAIASAGSIVQGEGVNEGDIIWYDRYAGHDQVIDGSLYRVITINDIIMVE